MRHRLPKFFSTVSIPSVTPCLGENDSMGYLFNYLSKGVTNSWDLGVDDAFPVVLGHKVLHAAPIFSSCLQFKPIIKPEH